MHDIDASLLHQVYISVFFLLKMHMSDDGILLSIPESNRLHLELPSAFEGSVLIMSKSGTGMAMFSMGEYTG